MNTADLRSLADRAEGVQGRQAARLDELHERIRVTRRRRTAAAVGAAAMAVVLAGTALVFRPDAERTTPTPDPTPSPSVPDPTPMGEVSTALDRPLTYVVDQTIHYGDEVFDTGRDLAQVDITDAGVVYLTMNGELWFTDGSSKRQIDRGPGSYHEVYEPVTAALGSRIGYLTSDGTQPLSLVVHDVASGEVVLEAPAGESVWPRFDETRPEALVYFMTADQVVVYYTDDSRASGSVRLVSYDIETGQQTELTWDEMVDIQVSTTARTLGYRLRGEDVPVMRET